MFFAVSFNITAKDDLVKLQKKEALRRKTSKKAVIIITNENIIRLSQKSSKKVSHIKTTNSNTQLVQFSRNNHSESPNRNKNKEYWKSLKTGIVNSINFYEEKVKSLTNKLNKLSSDYLIVDYPPSKRQIKIDIDKTRQELSKSKQQVPYFKKKLEELYDRARRESIPPGWMR